MIRAYVITEDQSDVDILKKFLPDKLVEDTQFVAASSQYNAQSLATTILAVKTKPVALVLNANTDNESLIEEKSDLLYQLLHQSSPGIPFQVLIAVPELEAIFFQDKHLIEKLVKRSLNNVEWQLAKSHPKEFLIKSLDNNLQYLEIIFNNISADEILTLEQHSIINQMASFLSSVYLQLIT